MKPLRLSIQGDFWDSYVYRDRLYLWLMDNSVRVYRLSALLSSIGGKHGNIFIPLVLGEGNKLYHEISFASIAQDPQVMAVIKTKLEAASKLQLDYDISTLKKYEMGEQSSPFEDLPDDLTIFANNIYASGTFGLMECETHKKPTNRFMIDRQANKRWDGVAIKIKPGRRTLAIAGLDCGLFEFDVFGGTEPKLISPQYTSDVDWLFASIYATSKNRSNFLACYKWNQEETGIGERPKYKREFTENIDLDPFVKPEMINWGRQEKIFRATQKEVDVFRYTQGKVYDDETRQEAFECIGSIPWGNSTYDFGRLRRAGVSYFGSVLEYENGLRVLQSNGHPINIKENVVRWRVFPKSKNYENHLHLIFEDRIEILCFINDFLIDQREKLAGIEFKDRGMWQE